MARLPMRKRNRLIGYDYSSAGYYFITLCTRDSVNLFGEIVNGEMYLSDCRTIAKSGLLNISSHYDKIHIDKSVVMPNHVHLIVVIDPAERMNPFPTGADIPNVIGKYKAGVTRTVGDAFMRSKIWQKSCHNHILRDEAEHQRINTWTKTCKEGKRTVITYSA